MDDWQVTRNTQLASNRTIVYIKWIIGIPNLYDGGRIDEPFNRKQQINDNSLFILRKRCRFPAYGGRNDKVKVYLICFYCVQKVERVPLSMCKNCDNLTISRFYYSDSQYKNRQTA